MLQFVMLVSITFYNSSSMVSTTGLSLQGLYEVRFEAERIYINNVAKLTMKFVKDSLDNISLPGNRYVAALEVIKRLREKAGLVTDTSDDVKAQVKLIRFIKSLNEEIGRREIEKSALLEKMKKGFDEILAAESDQGRRKRHAYHKMEVISPEKQAQYQISALFTASSWLYPLSLPGNIKAR